MPLLLPCDIVDAYDYGNLMRGAIVVFCIGAMALANTDL